MQYRDAGALLRSVEVFIGKHALLKRGDRVLVGVSGGPDSMVLLHLLHDLAPRLGIMLHAAHLHHGLRGRDADRDRELARRVCRSLKIPFTSRKADVRAAARREGLSLETAARRARYAFLRSVARRGRIGVIALGHTADDQVETFLMRLLRGAGGRGLGAISPSRREGEFTIIRPLLCAWKRKVLAFARERGIPFREDRTNRDVAFLRNRVRRRLIPYLEKRYHPAVRETLRRAAEIVGAEHALVEVEARAVFQVIARKRKGGEIALPAAKLSSMPRALSSEVVRIALEEAGAAAPAYADVTAVLALCAGQRGGIHHLAGCAAAREYGALVIGRSPRGAPKNCERELDNGLVIASAPIPVRFRIRIVPKEKCGRLRKNSPGLAGTWGTPDGNFPALVERFSWDLLEGRKLTVRNRRPGDRYRPLGMSGAKKVKSIMIDGKLPRGLRAVVPLLVCDGEPIWLVGYRIADGFRVTRATRRVLELRVEKA